MEYRVPHFSSPLRLTVHHHNVIPSRGSHLTNSRPPCFLPCDPFFVHPFFPTRSSSSFFFEFSIPTTAVFAEYKRNPCVKFSYLYYFLGKTAVDNVSNKWNTVFRIFLTISFRVASRYTWAVAAFRSLLSSVLTPPTLPLASSGSDDATPNAVSSI